MIKTSYVQYFGRIRSIGFIFDSFVLVGKRTNLFTNMAHCLMTAWELFIRKIETDHQEFVKFRDHVEHTFRMREERLVDRTNLSGKLTQAAVLFPLIVPNTIWEGERFDGPITDHIYLLLEKRSAKMNKNPGDMAFAGGKVDDEDEDLKSTAYREAEEEIGITSDQLSFIAYMDEFISTSKYIVRTVVCWLVSDLDVNDFRRNVEKRYQPLTQETENTVVVPLTHLLNSSSYSNIKYDIKSDLTSSQYGYIRYFDIHEFNSKTKIWGLTASMIRRFLDLIFPDNLLPPEPILL